MRQLTFFLLMIFSLAGFSQESKLGLTVQISNPVRDTKVGWFDIDSESFDGYNVKDQSYSLGLLANYKINQSFLRLRFSYTKIDIEEYNEILLSGSIDYNSTKGRQDKFSIAPGIAWKINKNKLQGVFGFEVPFIFHGEYTLDEVSRLSLLSNGEILRGSRVNSVIPKGYTIGLGAIIGFNYFLHQKFSIGSEYSPSLYYANLGGETLKRYLSIRSPDEELMDSQTTSDELKGFTFFEHRFSVGISYWFNNE